MYLIEFKGGLVNLNTSNQLPEFLTKKEVAELLRVSIKTINNWIKKGIIPYMRVGGPKRKRTLFRRSEIIDVEKYFSYSNNRSGGNQSDVE